MQNVKYIEHFQARPQRDMILYRLGYRKNKTVLNEIQTETLDKTIDEGILLCDLKGAFLRLKVAAHTEDYVKLENDVFLRSRDFSKYLKSADEVLLMASTAGNEIMQEIALSLEKGDAARALILDSVASQTADAGLDWLTEFMDKILIKEGRKTANTRFSPGYGDFDLQNQKVLFEMLKLDKIGVCISEKFMLIPEKSVIAVAGIESV